MEDTMLIGRVPGGTIGGAVQRAGTSRRPLLGLTFLLVEDSRYCSEAVRLMCLRSGARLRRADCLKAAYRHLATYRPSIVLVDIGLPDGSGMEMIEDLAAHHPNAPIVLATSGDDAAEFGPTAMAAGADGYIAKPLKNLIAFQDQILSHFPDRAQRSSGNVVPITNKISPDPLAMKEDLSHVLTLIADAEQDGDQEAQTYCLQFLGSVADAAGDPGLQDCVRQMSGKLAAAAGRPDAFADVVPVLQKRLAAMKSL